MKKLLLSLSMLLICSISFCQSSWDKSNWENKEPELFTFDKLTIVRLEKESRFNKEDDLVNGHNLYWGAIIIKNENDSLKAGKYIKLPSILATDQFYFVGSSTVDDKMLLQNVKSKLYYVTTAPFSNYFDYSRTDADGFRDLIKRVPRKMTLADQQLVTKYKLLIKSGQANCTQLRSIQNKCLTKGYFDESKMSKLDIQNWNKNLSALKATYAKLNDIDKYEDKDDRAQNKLSSAELVSLGDFNTWLSNYIKIE